MDPHRRVLVVGHNAINQALLCTACGLGPEDFRRFGFKNGGIAEVEHVSLLSKFNAM
jgi:broad specificity phosphatase PhoE